MRLRIENISKSYGGQKVLDDLSFTVEEGELFFLIGSSGCGKSTLLRIISGLLAPDGGRIFFDSRDVTETPAENRGLGLVFQNYALWPHMTVWDNISFGLETRGEKRSLIKEKVSRILGEVRLEGLEKRYPAELSGGQQQRVALARALVIEPPLVLLDEPLSNLDAGLRLEMRGELRRIHKSLGVTMVYVTHDQKEALSLADRMALLHNGKLEQVGAPYELYKTPSSSYAASFLGETNFLPGTFKAETAEGWLLETPWGEAKIPSDHVFGAREKGEAVISLRPENLSFQGSLDDPCFEAEVLEKNFLGDITQLVLKAFGQKITAETVSGADRLKPGDRTRLWPKAAEMTAYKREG
ncbi:ABC transporter ATP-binding protein [bacterium]|nr:ABC transporter ATP-binding protein [bacterium]